MKGGGVSFAVGGGGGAEGSFVSCPLYLALFRVFDSKIVSQEERERKKRENNKVYGRIYKGGELLRTMREAQRRERRKLMAATPVQVSW